MREGKRGNSDNIHKIEQREREKEETMITIIKKNKERGKRGNNDNKHRVK